MDYPFARRHSKKHQGGDALRIGMAKLRVLILFDTDGEPPAGQDYTRQLESGDEAEYDVARALMERGHEVRMLGFRDSLDTLVTDLRAHPVDVVFNLAERFRDHSRLDYGVAALLEMLDIPYTGASAEGLMLARNKALTKMVLAYQGLRIPHFFVCQRGQQAQRPSDVRFPLIVKPLDEDASVGIAKRSVVHDDAALAERIAFIHTRLHTAAIVEEFIAGRELYVGVVDNDPPRALPPIEMVFSEETAVESRIATFKAKWSHRYRDSHGIQNCIAENLSTELRERLAEVAVRAYQAAGLRDYGRIDVRLAHDDEIYIVEANPNPYLADGEDLAWAAEEGGQLYPQFIERIAELAASRRRKS
jgi:D-alanine-D-alanine ligase